METLARFLKAIWSPVPLGMVSAPGGKVEDNRHANLIVGFTTIGGLFSLGYASYYLLIAHYLGATAILCGGLVFLTLPLFCLRKGRPDAGALWFVLALIAMFSVLCVIDGGVKGHAVAWLATLPFCLQLLILRPRVALTLCGLIILLVAAFASADLWMPEFPVLYPENHHETVTLMGYTGLAVFMCILGFIVEYTRRDVLHERDLAEAELKNVVEELTRLNLEKNEFMGIAAHDISNPLSVVYGYAEMLRDDAGVSGEERAEFIREIAENSGRMRKIVQDLLDVNTIESGMYPLKNETIPLRPLVENCLAVYREPARKKVIALHARLAEVEARTDAGALSQILDNLVSNAVKYAKPGGEVTVTLSACPEGFRLEVFNEGRGFTEEDQTKLFTRFAKLSTRPTAGEGSVGLGLSITHKIVQAMQGEIVCESELNKGALFRVTLPG